VRRPTLGEFTSRILDVLVTCRGLVQRRTGVSSDVPRLLKKVSVLSKSSVYQCFDTEMCCGGRDSRGEDAALIRMGH
jgi:hypothetical protein